MENVALVFGWTDDSASDVNAAVAVCRYYLDYSHKELRPVFLDADAEVPWDEVHADNRLFVLGKEFAPEDISRIRQEAGDLIWIDNHAEALTAAYAFDPELQRVKGLREGGRALCELAWDSYFAWKRFTPILLDCIGRYAMNDTSREDWESRILPYIAGIRELDLGAYSERGFEDIWKIYICIRSPEEIKEEFAEKMIARGKEILHAGA